MPASMQLNDSFPGLLSQEEYAGLQYFTACLLLIFSTLGLVTNFLNIKTFYACGLVDGFSVSFMALSISDMVTSVLTVPFGIAVALHAQEALLEDEHYYLYDPLFFYYLFINFCNAAYVVTVLTTVYIAIARCACVAFPFAFKHVFTRKRSILLTCGFWIVSVAAYTPIFASQHFEEIQTPDNSTRYQLSFKPARESIKDIVFLLTQAVFSMLAQTVVIVCVVLMKRWLQTSANLRKSPMSSAQSSEFSSNENSSRADLNKSFAPSGKDVAIISNGTKIIAPSTLRGFESPEKSDTDGTDDSLLGTNDSAEKLQDIFETKSGTTSTSCKVTFSLDFNDSETEKSKEESVLEAIKTGNRSEWSLALSRLGNLSSSPSDSQTDLGESDSETFEMDHRQGGQKYPSLKATHPTAIKADALTPKIHKIPSNASLQKSKKDRVSSKDRRLVHQVILISVIFIVFNTPMILLGLLGPLEPSLDADWGEDKYVRLYVFFHAFKRFLEQISSSVNLFIYWKYNLKFRQRCNFRLNFCK